MPAYRKGADFERELVRSCWERGWAAARIAGSGSVSYDVPDVVALKENRIISIECKSTRKEKLSLRKAMESLEKFVDTAGGNGYLAIKFYRKKPRFYEINHLMCRKTYTVSEEDNFLTLDSVLGKQSLL